MDQWAVPDGDSEIYFLPWRTGFGLARTFGLIPASGAGACYRLPADLVCADPNLCAARIRELTDRALRRASLKRSLVKCAAAP